MKSGYNQSPDGRDPGSGSGAPPSELRRALSTRVAKVILAVTLLLGLLAAVGLVAGLPPAARTLAAVATPVQSLMSVTAPFLGVLMTTRLRSAHLTTRLPTLLAAVAVAVGVALFGVAVSALAVAAAPSAGTDGTWQHTAAIVLGCVVVQVIAQLVGTGLGLLVRRPVLACIATILLPLGLWAILGAAESTRPAQDWLTPFAGVGRLTTGAMTAHHWLQSVVVFLLWGVGLNALGAARVARGLR